MAPAKLEQRREIIDDKSATCLAFILERLRQQNATTATAGAPIKPFIIGLNGVQGVGKTTLVHTLAHTLRKKEGIKTLVVSIDDFYLKREDQIALAASHTGNKLLQVRGQPGTHDMELAQDFFTAICQGKAVRIPQYDKSAYQGKGDRVPDSQWETVDSCVQVVIFEGWCVGFQPLHKSSVEARWKGPSRTLKHHQLEHLTFANDRLSKYDDAITTHFDAMIHVDAEMNEYVYDWRLEQEAAMREQKGTGMTDDQVVEFVDAYYPAYELFSDQLREGLFGGKKDGHQLRLVVGRHREVKQTIII